MMRIAFITEYDNIGGGESNLMNLCQALGRQAEVTLFCHGQLHEQASARGIACRRVALTGKRWIRALPVVSFPRSLRKELEGFDIVHAYSLNVLPRLTMLARPLVWTTHGYWERPRGWRARVIGGIVDRVVTVSSDVDRYATFGEKQRKIYLGTPIGPDNVELKKFDPANVRMACIGRFQRIKGQDLLLQAMGTLAAANPARHITLELIGDVNGSAPDDMEFRHALHMLADRVRATNLDIRFLGFQRTPLPSIRQADIVVVPSRYESFSMVAIEALACGKPVVAPAIGGPKDIVDSDRIGTLFEPGNAEALGVALEYAIAAFGTYSAQECVQRARVFSVERQAQAHMRLYLEMLHD